MASLFIRCDEEVWLMARALAKNENRSVTKQLVHMIREEAQRKGIETEAPENQTKNIIQEKDSSSQETAEIVEKPNLINNLEGLMVKQQQGEEEPRVVLEILLLVFHLPQLDASLLSFHIL